MDVKRLTHDLNVFIKDDKLYTSCEFEIWNSNDNTLEMTRKEFKISDQIDHSLDSAQDLAQTTVEEWRFNTLNNMVDGE